jgi:hypothetical protein
VKRLLLVTVLLAASQASAELADVPPELQKDMACMARVLQSMPGIDDVKTGTERGPNTLSVDPPRKRDVWDKPFVRYRVRDKGDRLVLRFIATRDAKPNGSGYSYEFWTGLNGLSPTPEPPRDWRTGEVMGAWKSRCGVDANALYN